MNRTTELKKKKLNRRKHARNNSKARYCQKWVAGKIGQMLGVEVGKDLDIESRPMGQSGSDVILRGRVLNQFPAIIECASGESISWLSKIRQVKKNKEKDSRYKFWLVFLKRKEFKRPIVILDAGFFFDNLMYYIADKPPNIKWYEKTKQGDDNE
jgi:hypothetical protein